MIWVAFILVVACTQKPDDVVVSFEAELGGKSVVYNIRESERENIPDWPAEASGPALSPREAIRIGRNGLKMLEERGFFQRQQKSNEWELVEASLMPVGKKKWIWKLRFEEVPGVGKGSSGIPGQVNIVVLMNGKILIPSRPANDSD